MGHAHQFRLGAQVHSCGKCIAWGGQLLRAWGQGVKDNKAALQTRCHKPDGEGLLCTQKPWIHRGPWPQAQTQDRPFKKHLCTLALLEFWVG